MDIATVDNIFITVPPPEIVHLSFTCLFLFHFLCSLWLLSLTFTCCLCRFENLFPSNSKSYFHLRSIDQEFELIQVNSIIMGGDKDLHVVQNVDLARYAGRWYEIASMPSTFQPKTGTNSRATYTLKEDQTIDVLNETWVDGKRSYISGSAYKADPASPDAKLKVRFVVPPFFPVFPVTGDYWVMKLDDNYQWALVGQPSRKFLWVWISSSFPSFSVHLELPFFWWGGKLPPVATRVHLYGLATHNLRA